MPESSSTFYPQLSPRSPVSPVALESPTKKGWLKRQSVGIMKSWQSRWFILEGNYLSYFSSEDVTKSPPIGQIFLPGHSLSELPLFQSESQKFLFELYPENEQLSSSKTSQVLCADSEEERKEWVKCIKQVLYSRRGGAIFGCALEVTLHYENMKNKDRKRKVPQLVQMCVEYLTRYGLETEGLFRLPGRVALVKQLRNSFDIGQRPRIDLDTVDIHTVASLMKMYLRELPGPIIPVAFYESVMHLITRELDLNPDPSIDKLGTIVAGLPSANYDLLCYLCRFLHEVGRRSEVNRMTEMNLATVFSQSFIEPEDDDPALLMGTADNRSKAAFILISQFDRIFPDDLAVGKTEKDEPPIGVFDFATPERRGDDDDVVGVVDSESHRLGRISELSINDGGVGRGGGGESCCVDEGDDESMLEAVVDQVGEVEGWMVIEKRFVAGCDYDDAGATATDKDARSSRLVRRSMSLGGDGRSSNADRGNGQPLVDVDLDTDVLDLLDADPSDLAGEDLVGHFVKIREELRNQRLVVAGLRAQLAENEEKSTTVMKLVMTKLDEEKRATSEAVNRVVQIQAELGKYHMKYGPL